MDARGAEARRARRCGLWREGRARRGGERDRSDVELRSFGSRLFVGSLAGLIVTLLFFWIVGLGISIGAHLNAALAETPLNDVRGDPTTETEFEAA